MMKMGIIARAAVLLAVVVLVAGCPAINHDIDKPTEGNVRLNFNQTTSQRTILPNEKIEYFKDGGFELRFTDVSSGIPSGIPIVITAPFEKRRVELPPGDYTLEVFAYLTWDEQDDEFDSDSLAATGVVTFDDGTPVSESAPITVTSGRGTDINIMFHAIAVGTGTGEFKWNILFPPECVMATMTLRSIDDHTFPREEFKDMPNTSRFTGDDKLDIGYYYVDFELDMNNGSTFKFRHILHIYENMTSVFDYPLFL